VLFSIHYLGDQTKEMRLGRHAGYVLQEVKRIQMQLKTANGREDLEGPGIIGTIIL